MAPPVSEKLDVFAESAELEDDSEAAFVVVVTELEFEPDVTDASTGDVLLVEEAWSVPETRVTEGFRVKEGSVDISEANP